MYQRDYNRAAGGWLEWFWPDYLASSVSKIDFSILEKRGIKAILIDLDDTVVARAAFDVPNDVTRLLRKQRLPIYIATNRPRSRDLKNLKESLNASGIIHPRGIYGKPSKHYYREALKTVNLPPHQVAMIGDRLLQDTFGARRAGLVTVAVTKFGKPRHLFDRLISNFELRFKSKIRRQAFSPVKSKQAGRAAASGRRQR